MSQRPQSVQEGFTYYWGRRLFHLSAASVIPLLGLVIGYGYALGMTIMVKSFLVGRDVARFIIPGVNVWFIEWLDMLLKPGERRQITAATYLAVASLAMLLLFNLEIASLALMFLALGDPAAGFVGKQFR